MKKIFSISILLGILIINYSCAQDIKPLDYEGENTISPRKQIMKWN